MSEHLSLLKSDRDSVYSFDSVSTNERLLDRLDFDNESIMSVDSYRSSNIGSQSLPGGRNDSFRARDTNPDSLKQQSWQTNDLSQHNGLMLPQQPMNNLSAIRRMKDYTKPTDLTRGNVLDRRQLGSFSNRNSTKVNRDSTGRGTIFSEPNNANDMLDSTTQSWRKELPPNINYAQNGVTNFIQPNINSQSSFNTSSHSIDGTSLTKPDIFLQRNESRAGLLSRATNSSVASVDSRDVLTTDKFYTSNKLSAYNELVDMANNEMLDLNLKSKLEDKSSYVSTHSEKTDEKRLLLPHNNTARSSHVKERPSGGTESNISAQEHLYGHALALSENRAESVRGQVLKSQELLPESRTLISQELRAQGKHREASYQLQIAANEPFNNTKAMYLYALALKHGQGVKQNYNASLKWLCKCILRTPVSENNLQSNSGHPLPNTGIVASRLDKLSQQDLLQLVLASFRNSENSGGLANGETPEMLYKKFKSYSKSEVNKILAKNKSKSDVVALSYFELGVYLLNGIGGSSNLKTDEANGIILLSKSAAMCNVEAMEQLGEVWATKTKYRKKDLSKAAAWLRSAEIFGAKSIGNSWIYKEKYLRSNTN